MTVTVAAKRNKYNIIEPPPMHINQERIWNAYFSGKYRFFVVYAGRRFGKSTVCKGIMAWEAINNGKKVWWVGKTNKDAGEQWRDTVLMLEGLYTKKSETDKRLEFQFTLEDGTKTTGEITFRSAEEPENLRGSGLDLIILDEAAFQSQNVWKVLRPSLSDKKGNCIFISTPNGYNWFYSFYQRGIEENKHQFPDWWSRTYTSYDNPFLDPAELDQARKEMTETEFNIEYMAQVYDDVGKVFTNVRSCATGMGYDIPVMGAQYSIGIDLARKHDASVVSVVDIITGAEHKIYRFIDVDWEMQKQKMASIIYRWHPVSIYADVTAVGQPVLEDLQKLLGNDYMITPVVLSPSSKPPLIQNLAVKLQNKEITILQEDQEYGRIQLDELLAYELKRSPNGLNWTYSAPKGGKDDTVIALALALMGVSGKKAQMVAVDNIFYPTKYRTSQTVTKRKTMLSEYAKRSHDLQEELLKTSIL